MLPLFPPCMRYQNAMYSHDEAACFIARLARLAYLLALLERCEHGPRLPLLLHVAVTTY